MNSMNSIDTTKIHACGGTILSGGSGKQAHRYCDRCRAFAYVGSVPSGTDEATNRAAWDAGDEMSPYAAEAENGGSEFCETRWRATGEKVPAIYWIYDETGQRFSSPGEGRSGVCSECDSEDEGDDP